MKTIKRSILVAALALAFGLNASAQSSSTNIVTGNISVPGEQDTYVFNLGTNALFYFDALTNVSTLRWSLAGPPGLMVSERPFTSSDAQSIGNPVLLLPAGDYTLTIDCSADATDTYAFRFVNLVSATLLTPGTVVSAGISPANETDFYQFNAVAGDRFFFDQISRTGVPNLYWRLIDPYGGEVFAQGFSDVGSVASPTTLPADGTYTLLVEGYIFDASTGSYSFNVSPQGNVPPPPLTGTSINIGDLVVSNLVANTTNDYIFTLPAPARLVFDSHTNSPNLNWTLQGPSGTVINQRTFNNSDSFSNPSALPQIPAGNYRLRVRGNANNQYRFRLLDITSATPITTGVNVSGALVPGREIDMYRFTVSAGNRYYFDSLSLSNMPNAYWKLIDPYGAMIFATPFSSDGGLLTLTLPGTYTLLIDGYYAESGDAQYTFNIRPVVDGSQALALGSVVNASITVPGQRQHYSFTLGSAARLYFDNRTNQLRWSLTGPTGTIINSRPFTSSDGINNGSPLIPVPAGDYTLTIFGSGDDTGGYGFRLFDVSTAAAMTPGTPVSSTLSPANETDAYAFTTVVSGKYFFDAQVASGMPNSQVRLFDSYGNLFINTGAGSDSGPVNIPAGNYLMLVEGYYGDVGNGTYTFSLIPAFDATQALTLGATVNGAIAAPGQFQNYTFNLPTAARLYFDSLTNVGFRWSLTGPVGVVVNGRSFLGSDGINNSAVLLPLVAGNYTLTVFGSGDLTGGYAFRLFDVANATALTPGTPVSSTLNPANETDAYTFTLGSSGRYFFDGVSSSGLPNAQTRLFDSHGNLLVNVGLGSDAGPFNLLPDTYVLLVEGYYGDAGSGSYTLNFRPVTDGAAPLTLGNLVDGSVATPGQSQVYAFNLPGPARLYFDSLTNNNLRWTLTGPAGTIVNNRGFTSTDGINNSAVLLPVAAGNYTLTVFGPGDTTGGYRFRLSDVATVSAMTPGTPINTTLNPGNETDLYQFTIGSAGKYFLHAISATGLPNAQTRLFDSRGNLIINVSLNSDFGPLNLLADTYVLLVEGYHSDLAAGSYSLNLTPVTDGTQALALGSVVNGSLVTPGQYQNYTFTLASSARLYFDSLTNSSLRWSLSGPAGNVVNNRPFSTDWISVGNPVLALGPGSYTITVSGSASAIGGYQFVLSDFAAATILTPGTVVSVNNFPANSTDLYQFTVAAGDRFFFDRQSSVNIPNAHWRLIDPYDNVILNHNLSTDAGTNVLVAGTYVLLIEGYIGDGGQGSYSFNVRPEGNVPPTPFTGAPLTIGNVVAGSLPTAGSTSNYVFTLATASRLYFDALTNVGFNWTLRGPGGVIVNARGFAGSDGADISNPMLVLPGGDYQITIGGAAGGYQFRVLDFASGSAFTPGLPLTNTLAGTRNTVFYQFTGNVGDKFYFDGRPSSGFSWQPYVRIFSPLNNIVMAQNVNANVDTFSLPQSGTYVLAVEGRIHDNNASGTYAFNLQPVTFPTNSLTIGATVAGSINQLGQRHYYTVTIPSAGRYYFDALTNDGTLNWRMDAPWGTVVDWRNFQSTDALDIGNPMLNLEAGNYTLTLATSGFQTLADYQFRLLDSASSTPFAPGTVVNGTLNPARGTVFYHFTGVAGDKFYFDGRPSSGFSQQPYVRIYSPLNNILMANNVNSDVDTFTLPQTGTYVLMVEGRIYENNASGNYAFNLQPVTYPTNNLTVGSTVVGSINQLGQRHYFTLNLASAGRYYFDALTNDGNLYWRVDAPWGTIVDWRSFQSTDAIDIGNPMLNLDAGNYTLTLATSSFASLADYQFRLLDFATSTAFTPGTVVSNALAPARGAAFYSFAGNAGDKFYFDGRPSSGFSQQPYVRIYSPLNNIVMANNVNGDVDTFTLPQAGTYVLTVEGRIYENNASGNYTFNLQPVTFLTNNLTIGSTVVGSINQLGQRHYFTFNLASAGRYYFDALTNDGNLYWRLDAPWGTIVDWRGFQSSDGADFANPLLGLEPGNYTLTLATSGFSSLADYQFRLLDFASSTAFTPGNVVSATLSPARGTVFYSFSGNAGDRFYFDGRPSSGFSQQPYARIFSPLNNIVIAQNVNTDADTFSLPQTGTHILAVEGRIYEVNASGNYTFNLVPNPSQPQQPLFETNNSPDLIVSAVSVSPPSGLSSGDTLTVHWTVQNAGNVATAGSFTDRVTVRNTATSQIIVNSTLAYNEADPGNGPIGAGGTRMRQLNVTLPDGTNGTGVLEVTVTTDVLNTIAELNSGGTGEANNATTTTITTTLAPYPDLLVHSINTAPPTGWLPGSTVAIQWVLTNAGPRGASNGFSDSVVIRNTNTAYIFNTNVAYVLGDPGNGAIEPAGSRNRTINFNVPNNANAYGAFEITVTTDIGSQVFELNGTGSAETNNSRVAIITSAPDLRIAGVNVTATPVLQSGANLTIDWNTENHGNVESGGSFSDRVFIRNLTTAEVLLDTSVAYSHGTSGAIPPGGSRPRTRAFQLPDGPRGAGSIEITVTADTFNQLLELNGAGTGEANNSSGTTITPALAPYPDLQVVNLVVEPAAIGGGTNLTIRWQDTNSGNTVTSGSWSDRVQIVNTNNGLTLLDTTVFYNPGALGPLTNGTARERSHNFTLPNNSNSAGGLVFTVTADTHNQVFEHNPGGTGENNNAASITRFSSLTPLPDLAVHDIIVPAVGAAGQPVQVVYVVTNRGTAIANGPWTDNVYLSSDTTIGADQFLGSFQVTGSIPTTSSISRTQTVVVPIGGDAGDLHFVVLTDAGNAVLEQTDSNNSLLDADNFNVPLALTLTLSASSIAENAINPNIAGTVTRNGSRAAALTVNLMSSDTDEIIVPANVVIGPAQVTANFTATVQQDGVYDGDQLVTVTASATGYPSANTNITVIEGNIPFLTLAFTTNVLEGSNFLATITRDPVSATPLTVQFNSSDPTQLSAPATVEIPGNMASANFTVTAVEDTLVERTNNYTLTATASGFIADAESVRIRDNDIPDLVVELATDTISEGAGPTATSGTVTRSFPGGRSLVVALFSGNTSAALVPSTVTIPAGATSAVFTVSAVNDAIVDGPQTAAIGAAVLETGTSFVLRQGTPDALTVTDDDGPTLTLVIATDLVGEGLNPATTATVTRNTSTNLSLNVTLMSGDTSEATVPPSVSIPAGAFSAVFNIASVADGVTDGNQTVSITASASGFTAGTDTLVVSDNDLPDLVIADVITTNNAFTDQTITAELVLENRGLLAANGTIVQRVFISSDAFLGNDTLGAQVSYTGPFPVGDLIEQLVSLRMPADPGNYWIIAQTDVTDSIFEALENNNTFIEATPIVVEASYTATISTAVTTALANTPVPMSGQATMRGTGAPAAFVPIRIHLEVRGVRRTFDVVTAADGTFSYTFQPLPNEAGVYRIAAAHPGVTNPPHQDTFTLIGMSVAPVGLVNVIEGGTVTGSTRIDNLSDVPLTALNAVVVTNQPNLTVTLNLTTNTLAGFAVAALDYTIEAADASVVQSPVVIQVSSAEGVVVQLVITVRVEALRPRLVANPASLQVAMQRGGQTTVPFTIANQGGRDTGPLEVVAPNQPWLSIASPVLLPPLPPGSNTTVTVLLTPASDLPLGDYNGSLVVRSTNSAINIPYSFRAVSDARGNMLVTAEDEYTYFAAGNPRLTNATVILTDALSGTAVVTNSTGTNGSILFTNLTEAYYLVDVRAEGHSSFRQTALVVGGQTTNIVAFLPRQTVRYTFTVVPTTVEDRYAFTVESTFETQVPTPVVTISPASIDLSQYPGTEFQVQLTVANHGLIAADNVRLDIPSTEALEVTPLISDIGRLAANTSLTIPVLVRRLSGGARLSQPQHVPGGARLSQPQHVPGSVDLEPRTLNLELPGDASGSDFNTGQCSVTARMLWDYLCGPNVVNRDTAFYMFDSTGCDIVDLYFQVYELVPEEPGPGPVITTQDFIDYLNQFRPLSGFEAPPGYRFQCRETPPAGSLAAAHGVSVSRAAARMMASAPAPAGNEVCARVQLRLDQRAVLARDAFRATLEIVNETGDPLEDVLVTLAIEDSNGALVNSVFGIRAPELTGVSAVDGTGTLGGNSSGRASWVIIPTLDAAPTNGSRIYLVGGTLTYNQAGTSLTVPLAPAPIQVFPQPELLVRYFHERDVFSDDPFTPQIEPSVPYALAVQVNNVGYGAARSLKLTSGQPQIVDNEKGLLIEFKAIATQLENQSITPALEVDFGRIEPASNKIARWLFTSSLQGNFTNFSASFAHLDALGAQRLSLIRSVEIHELNRIVQAGGSFEDGRPDLLVNDVPDADRLPDTLYLSDGTITPVSALTSATINGSVSPGNLTVTVSAAAGAGWTYVRFGNPGAAEFRLVQVQRANGSIVPLGTNVWTTDRIFPGGEIRPRYTNLIHLLDHNITGNYTLTYAPVALLNDTNPPTSVVSALSSNSPPDFTVQWSGDDGTNGSGIAHFSVYVSVNGGAYVPWLTNTPLTSAIYNGTPGNTYAFYSRARDVAGNTEAAPGTFDTRTLVVSVVNSAPAFSAAGAQSVNETATFIFTPSVTDSDVPAQSITFSLLPGAPAGALFSPANGRITWPTAESDGGATYTFRIVATDNGSPSMSATQTVNVQVAEINTLPVITSAPSQVSVNEDTSSAIFLSATDSDLPAQTLTWQFIGAVPSGMSIDPNSGTITFMPSESQGPSTNSVAVLLRDNGTPNLSVTRVISVIVNEVNRAPVLSPIADQAAAVLTPLTFTAIATDADIPTNRLSFTLDPGAPAGARITRSGQFSWTPTRAQALSTNPITVRVTDNGLPALSHSRTFNVVIGDYFDVALGSTFVLAGQTGAVDITFTATRPVTNASFIVNVPVPGLAHFSLPAATPPVASSTIQQITPTQYQLSFRALTQFSGLQTVSSLRFVGTNNAPSAFVPLLVSTVAANQPNGSPLVPAVGANGRVIFINGAPLVELATNRVQLRVNIHAEPGPDYALESAPSLQPGAVWTELWSEAITTNLFQVVLPPHTNAARFYRAVRLN